MSPPASKNVVLSWVVRRGTGGATRTEAIEAFEMDGGPISGKLSGLHKDGLLACLEEKRGGNYVYVGPLFVVGRETREPRKNKPCPHCGLRSYNEDNPDGEWNQ
jgi:hypothetical protein